MQKVKEKEKAKSSAFCSDLNMENMWVLVSVQDKEKVREKVKRAILIRTSSRQSVSRFNEFWFQIYHLHPIAPKTNTWQSDIEMEGEGQDDQDEGSEGSKCEEVGMITLNVRQLLAVVDSAERVKARLPVPWIDTKELSCT